MASTKTTENNNNNNNNINNNNSNNNYMRVCYYTNWSQYRPGGGKFFPENIDPHLCTHIMYAFAKLGPGNLFVWENYIFGAINFGDNIFGGIKFGEISTIHRISIEIRSLKIFGETNFRFGTSSPKLFHVCPRIRKGKIKCLSVCLSVCLSLWLFVIYLFRLNIIR